jgi:serine/threonine-protein kinase RsbW
VRSPAEVPSVLRAVEGELEARGYPRKDLFAVRLALDEAITNAIKHGHRGDPRKCVGVSYRVTAGKVLAVVVGEGPGFDPHRVCDPLADENLDRPCGRGLLLMRRYTTRMYFNARGNGVALCRRHPLPCPPIPDGGRVGPVEPITNHQHGVRKGVPQVFAEREARAASPGSGIAAPGNRERAVRSEDQRRL